MPFRKEAITLRACILTVLLGVISSVIVVLLMPAIEGLVWWEKDGIPYACSNRHINELDQYKNQLDARRDNSDSSSLSEYLDYNDTLETFIIDCENHNPNKIGLAYLLIASNACRGLADNTSQSYISFLIAAARDHQVSEEAIQRIIPESCID